MATTDFSAPLQRPGGTSPEDRPDRLLELAERVVAAARPGEQVEAYVAHSRQTSVRVFDGSVESLSSAESEGVGVRMIAGHRQGFAYAAWLDDDVLAETLAEARDNAAFGTVDEFLGLTEPDKVEPAELDLFRPELADFPAAAKVDLALELERATRAADPRIRGVESTDYGDVIFQGAIATSTGVRAASQRTVCSLWTTAMADDGSGTQTGYGWSVGRSQHDLDVERPAHEAAHRATRLLGARKPASQRLTVLFEPTVTSSFLGVLSGALSAMSVLKGRSFLTDRLGDQIAVPFLTLVDDPTEPRAYGASRLDGEGLASRRNLLIDDGVLRTFLHNSYTGRRSGVPSNACAVRGGFKSAPGVGSRALTLEPGDRDQAQLLADMGDGLLVQSVTGLHSGTSITSGDFSVGIEGLMVRRGEVAEPVREATIASNLRDMLTSVIAVGSDREWLPSGAAGMTLAVADVTLSGS
jgi:PmbA protein